MNIGRYGCQLRNESVQDNGTFRWACPQTHGLVAPPANGRVPKGLTSLISEFLMKSAQKRGIRFARVTASEPAFRATSNVMTSCTMASTADWVLKSLGCKAVAIACDSSSPSHRLFRTTGKPPSRLVDTCVYFADNNSTSSSTSACSAWTFVWSPSDRHARLKRPLSRYCTCFNPSSTLSWAITQSAMRSDCSGRCHKTC
mmetsp:Transcript_10405/g.18118  ORF Transcript_10405/g.18118 Transcript_10405/m.18118 type:complete len:200 (-) Transcript_10405:1304-1903(-)